MVLMVNACGSNKTESSCDAEMAKLRSCGLIAADANVACAEPTGYFRCISDCRTNASCSELKLLMCQENKTGALDVCETRCEDAAPNFACANGDTIKAYSVCDDWNDCSDGSDEAGCPTFACADGEVIHATLQCDGRPDCKDESDEANCPTFTCKDGEVIPASQHCDGYRGCNDGSDEVDCPVRLMYALVCK